MSIAGLLVLLLLVSLLVAVTGRCKVENPPSLLWDLRLFASSYIIVIGPLAAFSVASAIFMAGVTINRQTEAFHTIIGMFLIASIVFAGTAMMFASTPGGLPNMANDARFERAQRFAVLFGIFGYGVGIGIAWLTLRPLLIAIHLQGLASVFTWVLLVTTIASCSRRSVFLYRLGHLRRGVAMLVPVSGLAFACAYYFASTNLAPAFWPETDAPLIIAVILLGIVIVAFGLQSSVLTSYGAAAADTFLTNYGHRIVLGLYCAGATGLVLLWFAVAFSTYAMDV